MPSPSVRSGDEGGTLMSRYGAPNISQRLSICVVEVERAAGVLSHWSVSLSIFFIEHYINP